MDMDLSTTFVNKVPQTKADRHYIVKTDLSSSDINIQILDNHECQEWQGTVSFDELKQTAEELEIPFDKFLSECKEALTTNAGVRQFEYFLENNKFSLIKKDQFQIKYLEIDLSASTVPNSDFTLAAVDLISTLRAELSVCHKESNDLNEKYQKMVSTMEKFVEEKNQLEKNLLEKFAVLLNSKKDKIAELQNLLAEKNRILEDKDASEEEATGNQSKRKSTDLVPDDDDDDSEDFMRPTQAMSQSVTRTLPKRVKLRS